MYLSPTNQAWSKAARLMAQCLGYSAKQKMSLYKTGHTFNEARNTHEINFKLLIKHPVETSMHKPLVKEGEEAKDDVLIRDLSLLKDLLVRIQQDLMKDAEVEEETEWAEKDIIDLTDKGPTSNR